MSAFVSTPTPLASATPPAPIADVVKNDGWFPDVSIAATREILDITTAVTDARLRDAIVAGMLSINRQLLVWSTAKRLAGAIDLAGAAPADQLAGGPRLVALYARAVRAEAAAELVDSKNNISATEAGRVHAEEQASPADSHRRLATHAVRDILGARRTKVRLV